MCQDEDISWNENKSTQHHISKQFHLQWFVIMSGGKWKPEGKQAAGKQKQQMLM